MVKWQGLLGLVRWGKMGVRYISRGSHGAVVDPYTTISDTTSTVHTKSILSIEIDKYERSKKENLRRQIKDEETGMRFIGP